MTRSFKSHLLALGSLALLTQGCSGGLDGGSIIGVFIGIDSATVLGPETVEINWEVNSNCTSYKIYQLSSSTSDSIATVSVPPVKVRTPNVQSDHTYTFAVGCVSATGDVSGLSYTKAASTWAKFNGVVTSSLDLTGTNPLVVLNWAYGAGTGTVFSVYAKQSSVPGDLSTWGLTQPSGYGTAYTETEICTTSNNQVKIGPGGDCSTSSLNSGNIYNFKVVAKYPDNQYSTDIIGNGTSIALPASFTPPNCILTKAGLGSDATSSYLFLRCSSGGSVTGSCSINNIKTTAYQAVNGVRTVVSDTLVGAGTLRIAPQISTTAANDRVVENLEIQYTCTAVTPNSTAVVRYDGTQTQYPKPFLKYGSVGYEAAPKQSYTLHPSYLGSSVAVGDFNCDGKPDLAVGLPKVSFNQSPYMNQNAESGAVKIYYDYSTTATGAISAASYQYISFRDLPSYAHFGQSLSSGNINKDVHVDGDGNVFSCDDLIIGAPGASNSLSNYRGAAYVFYGQPQGFPQPLDSAGLAVNSATCSGNISSEVCAPVKLKPTNGSMQTYFKIDDSETDQNANSGNGGTLDQVGFSVAYIRDFNADGYGDIAIGNPYCRWDGEAINAFVPPPGTSNTPLPPLQVGCVYVYFGGAQGIGLQKVGKFPDAAPTDAYIQSPFVKVYPPLPESNMYFGYSVAGGGDVDGRLPVPVPQNGGPGIILANGNDFIVGAPGFRYANGNQQELGGSKVFNWTVDEGAARSGCLTGTYSCPVDPAVMQGPATYSTQELNYPNKVTPPWNGAWAQSKTLWDGTTGFPVPTDAQVSKLNQATGIAFLYLGRSAHLSYDLKVVSGTSGTDFFLWPNQATTSPSGTTMNTLMSKSLMDRQNGSQYLTTSSSITWQQSPIDSFYNCGPRGGPIGHGTGNLNNSPSTQVYKHYSCLAGRNNFSIIYPTSSSTVISNFGANVAIAGAAEENAVALYQLGSFRQATAFKSSLNANNYLDLQPYAQGNVHSKIRGTALWELGIKGLNTPGTRDASCEVSQDTNSQQTFSGACASSYTGHLARSMIDENYNFPSSSWNPAPSATPTADINKDGYADALVTGNNQLFTFFGNYAADFSYQVNAASGSAGCAVTRKTSLATSLFASNVQAVYPGVPSPYTTYTAKSSALAAGDYLVTSEYPQFVLPLTGYNVRAAYLDDTTENSSLQFDYPTVTRATASTGAATACLPQIKSYAGSPTALTANDVNGDGIMDAVVGFSTYNTSAGLAVAALAGASGNGLALDSNFTVTASSSKLGTSVSASNWKFIDESSRRDMFVGALGYSSGSGAVYAFTGSNNGALSTIPSTTFTETANAPNLLGAEFSKIIGDINGDGYDDVWVPVKRIDVSGNVYYDALIYYGSAFGTISYNACLNRLSTITILGGGSASESDCQGTSSPQVAVIAGTQIRLPQYLSRPTGVSGAWALSVFPAGDVNRDGYQDLAIMDIMYSSTSNLYLFFGSGGGLVNGQPIMGPSLNQSPQLVTSNSEMVGNTGNYNWGNGTYGAGQASWYALTAFNINSYQTPLTQRPIVHGDFNGDGFEDIAFAEVSGYSAAHTTPWTCKNGMAATEGFCNSSPSPEPGGAYDAPAGGAPLDGHGYVVVFYGGSGGYQTPVNTLTGLANDFPSVQETCNDLYATCTYPAAGGSARLNSIRDVYNSMVYDTAALQYNVDTRLTACDPSSSTTLNPAYVCTSTLIRNPLFYNDTANGGPFPYLRYRLFGTSLAVMDANYDGIDDLMVGMPRAYNPGWAGRFGSLGKYLIGSTTVDDQGNKGGIYIYYGAKGAGLVAPGAGDMLGDAGMGLDSTATMAAKNNAAVFNLYPMYQNPAQPATFPELDRNASNNDANRNFGIGMTTGDFNGDGYDDIAVVSGNGQIYVYYGPICQVDNAKTTWQTIVYGNHNKACLTNTGGVAGLCGTASGAITSAQCTQFNLNATFAPGTTTAVGMAPQLTKSLYPQMIYITGSNSQSAMGSTLLSKRPSRNPATVHVNKNVGNINGDPEGTSDLLIGTYFMNDPNVLTGTTGLGYILFGHKQPAAGEMSSLPGLFATGSASYNGGLTSQTVSGNTYYFYTPLLMKPHTADGTVGSFFLYETSFGDVNGDGTGDILMPTREYNYGADGYSVISGGAFKLFY